MQVAESSLWAQTGTSGMVLKDWHLSTEMEFQRSEANHNLYFLSGEVPLILVLYVDGLFLTGDERLIDNYKSNLAVEFEMKDLVLMHYLLGLEVW